MGYTLENNSFNIYDFSEIFGHYIQSSWQKCKKIPLTYQLLENYLNSEMKHKTRRKFLKLSICNTEIEIFTYFLTLILLILSIATFENFNIENIDTELGTRNTNLDTWKIGLTYVKPITSSKSMLPWRQLRRVSSHTRVNLVKGIATPQRVAGQLSGCSWLTSWFHWDSQI